ncbi:hypothetical protein N7447_003145 [Penicillium robsamsonii]|uniref:uncharacterized protein n=1 Tax=Penicillium robsamsonii TaxID=1792511 RepID=UPI002547F518|nr:uncharacterized protein N7447_003145 [Penicillium robsamsonii]KAJ5837119.1 hypothetical protein N7447_003145 [Penicillium robsamsonii]
MSSLYSTVYQKLWGYQEVDLDEEQEQGLHPPRMLGRHYHSTPASFLPFLGWVLAIMLALALVANQRVDNQSDLTCQRQLSTYSPLMEGFNMDSRVVRVNGSLDWPSPYRGPPSAEVDAAWNRISIIRPLDIQLTPDEFLRLDSDPETAVQNAPEHGGQYFLVPQSTHHFHCLNLLRKSTRFKFDYYDAFDPDFTKNRDMFETHLDHCVEILRQFIMCHVDVGVVTSHWVEGRKKPWPNFNTEHVCKDYDQVLKWTEQHQLPVDTPLMPMKPAGVAEMSSPP